AAASCVGATPAPSPVSGIASIMVRMLAGRARRCATTVAALAALGCTSVDRSFGAGGQMGEPSAGSGAGASKGGGGSGGTAGAGGAACASLGCPDTSYCDESARVCVPKKQPGAPCTMAAECTSGVCVGGVCCVAACGDQGSASCGTDGTCDASGSCRLYPSG